MSDSVPTSAPLAAQVERLSTAPFSSPSLLTSGEKLYSPAAVAKASNVPGHRGAPHRNGATIFRHITKGIRAANGQVIRLEAVRVGCRWLTSLEALARFSEALTAAELEAREGQPLQMPVPPKQRARQQHAASAQLDALLGAASSE